MSHFRKILTVLTIVLMSLGLLAPAAGAVNLDDEPTVDQRDRDKDDPDDRDNGRGNDDKDDDEDDEDDKDERDGRGGKDGGIEVRTNKTAAVLGGDTAWVTISIRGKADVDDVKFVAKLEDGSVAYPTNTVDHSGPYNGYDLDDLETDYVAFQLTTGVPEKKRQMMQLELEATWTEDGETRSESYSVKVPVVTFSGEPYELVTDVVTVTEPDNGWVSLSLVGLAPQVQDIKVTIVDPSGLDVYYPAETFTSLHRDALLEDGETDEARLRINEAHWGETLNVNLRIDYTVAGSAGSRTHAVTINS